MVTTSTSAVESITSITNNSNMLLYNNHNNNGNSPSVAEGEEGNSVSIGGITTCSTSTTLEQYRLQLYNYALNMERLKGPPYTAAAAMAAAAAYASSTTVSTTTINCPPVHGANYTSSGHGTTAPPPPSSYLAGNLIAATSHMGRNQSALSQCTTNNRIALASMSLFPQRIFQPEEPKPQHSYIGLIAMAILSSAERKLVLSDIYQYILDNYPYFRTRGPGWRNSIRHNLSLNDCFIKSGRSANGKGHYWAIHPANMEDFRKGDFRRRKAQRKVRKHMGLAVDDNGTDSPSPPPAMDLPSPSPPSFQHIVMGSNMITPLATAAQHLAAQSFGWRFTQHHRQHQQKHLHQQQTGTHTAASYMGQVFTYRPQHYAAAAAAALCHSSSTQQHQQPQQLVTQNSHHHQPSSVQPVIDSALQQQNLILSSQSPIATNVQVNVINELFSHKRKRQFDVASLLAPDNFNKHENQHQYIRNHTISESETDDVRHSPCSENIEVSPSAAQNDIEIEDIDVVEASEDEDIEADYEEDDDDDDEEADSNSNSHSHSPTHSHSRDDDETHYIRNCNSDHPINPECCKISKLKMSTEEEVTVFRAHQCETNIDKDNEEPDEHVDQDDNNNESDDSYNHEEHKNNSVTGTANTTGTSSLTTTKTLLSSLAPPPPSSTHLLSASQFLEQSSDIHNQSNHQHNHTLPLNAEAHHLFGHYYGTYMAAAAARINSSIPSVNMVGNTN